MFPLLFVFKKIEPAHSDVIPLAIAKSSSPNTVRHYIPSLDGLRGIAVALVVLFHAVELGGGFIGVDIFFVLSGFLITSNLFKEFEEKGRIALGTFYFRRFLRLFPALVVMVSVVSAILLFFTDYEGLHYEILITICYAMNWFRSYADFSTHYFGHTWSLAIEEQFYLLLPLVMLSGFAMRDRRQGVLRLFFLLLGASLACNVWLSSDESVSLHRVYNGLDTRGVGLLLGCIGAHYGSRMRISPNTFLSRRFDVSISTLGLGATMFLAVMAFVAKPFDRLMLRVGYTIIDIAALVLILEIVRLPSGTIGKLCCDKVLV